jgi:hypothetical protein
VYRRVWVRRSHHDVGILPRPVVFHFQRPPRFLGRGFILDRQPSLRPTNGQPWGLLRSTRVEPARRWSKPLRRPATFPGCRVSIATSDRSVHSLQVALSRTQASQARSVPPSTFQRPRRFAPLRSLVDPLEPTATSEILPSGVHTPHTAKQARHPLVPSCRWCPLSVDVATDADLVRPAFRALFRAWIRCQSTRV